MQKQTNVHGKHLNHHTFKKAINPKAHNINLITWACRIQRFCHLRVEEI